jgi:CheY-like chemotaxis protein
MKVHDRGGSPGSDNRAGSESRTSDPPRGTIVVLDDDAVYRAQVERVLRSEGFITMGTGDVQGLAAILEAHDIDLILADSRLADGSDGWREAEALAARFGGVVVVAVSGYDADAIEATGGSVTKGYVLKGGSAFQLLQAIEEALRAP